MKLMETETDLRIVPAEPANLEAILMLLEEARRWLIGRGLTRQWPQPAPRSVFAQRLERGELYVALEGSALVGTFCLMWQDPPVWPALDNDAGYVHGLAIRRTAQGRGVGSVMLDAASSLTKRVGRPYLRLDCWAENSALCRYYERAGFQRRGTFTFGDDGFTVQRYERSTTHSDDPSCHQLRQDYLPE